MRVLQNMLDELQIDCPNSYCTDVITYDQYNNHLNGCKKTTDCIGCKIAINDSELETHQDFCVKNRNMF